MRRQFLKGGIWIVFAALALTTCLSYFYLRFQQSPEQWLSAVEKRINEQYREYRPFQYRWFGAPYARVHDTLSPENQGKTRKELGKILREIDLAERFSGPTVRSLQLRGRIDLLSGDYERAVQHYRQAILQRPSDSKLQLELAISLALRARKDDRALDYERSLEAMLQAGRHSQTSEVLFDTALLFTEIPLRYKALEAWQRTLSSEPILSWQREAQEQLTKLQQIQRSRQQRIHDLTASAGSYLAHANEADAALELVVDTAIEDWLPLAGSSSQPRQALDLLARTLKGTHQDLWLSDILKAPASPGNSLALKFLSESRKASLEGRLAAAGDAAAKAEILFSRFGNLAGTLRSHLEGVHSIVRHWNPISCIKALSGIRSSAAAKEYVWIEGQAWLEEVTCKTQTRQVEVIKGREEAYEWIRKTRYKALTLRALSFLTEDYVSFDSRLTIWKRGREGLQSFWNTPMQPERGYTFYYTLASSAQSAGDYQSAVALLEEGVTLLEQSGNRQLLALVLAYLAAWQWQAGFQVEANRSFDRMESLFKQLDKKETHESIREAETVRAQTELEAGNPDQALSRLDRLTGGMAFSYLSFGAMHRRRLLPTYGDAYLKQGKLGLASKHYEQIISESRRDLQSVHSHAQRDNAQHEIERAWKGLTEVQLRRNHPSEAWETWEGFRGGRFQSSHRLSSRPPEGISLLVYAFLPSGLSAWLVQQNGIEQHWVDARSARNEAAQLAVLAADGHSDLQAVGASSQHLYRLLIQPFAAQLAPTGKLIVDADGSLAGIPWAVLEDGQGHALVERFAIAQVAGWGEISAHLEDKSVNLSRPLILDEPALGPELAKEFPVLPELGLEARSVQALLANAELIDREHATLDALLMHLPMATLFHFAGHGVSYGDFGALLLAPKPGDKTPARLLTANELARLNLRRLQLAVLASCSSGVGEQSGLVNLDSLVRGFLEAGATRVVAARWNVNSTETDNIMTEFYKVLVRGEHPAEALRQAALKVRQTSPHPYFWAGLQVFGAP